MDTKCECKLCGKVKIVSFAHCILNGWPRCCGQRVTVKEMNVDLEKVVAEALSSIDPVIESMIRDRK